MSSKLIPYLLLVLVHLVAILIGQPDVVFYTKPLLLLSLLFYFFLENNNAKSGIKPIFIVALLTSFAGDTFLLFDDKKSEFFLFGLGSFLITQILYSLTFSKIKKGSIFKISNPIGSLIPLLFFVFIITAIWNNLDNSMKIPVTIYALSIFLMVFLAGNLKDILTKNEWLLIWGGALLFMFSDALIAVDKFSPDLNPFNQTQFLIMLTYLLAQLGIVVGVVSYLKQRNTL